MTHGNDNKHAFVSRLPEQIGTLKTDWNGLIQGDWSRIKLTHLFQSVQALAGSAGKFGYIQISENVYSLELYLKNLISRGEEPTREQADEVFGLIETIEGLIAKARLSQQFGDAGGHAGSLQVFFLNFSDSLAPGLDQALEHLECSVSRFEQTGALLQAVRAGAPAAVVIDDLMLAQIEPLANRLKAAAEQAPFAPKLVAISKSTDLDSRLSAMRAGAAAFFVVPIDATAVAARIRQLAAPRAEGGYRVMIVDDDRGQAEFAAAILRKAGMETCLETEPLQVLETLETFRPDLVLMDLYMPNADGIELTSIIRDLDEFVGIPIVFLSGEQDTEKQLDALSVGGDDFIAKPIRPRHLITLVNNRIRRIRAVRDASSPRTAAAAQEAPAEGAPDAALPIADPQLAPPPSDLPSLIRSALDEDGFQVLFQPMLDRQQAHGESYEMSLRLSGIDGTPLAEKEFMPVARQHGLLREIDRWLTQRALDAIAERRRNGHEVQLILRQSAETLRDGQAADWLREQLRRRQLVGTGLILEFNLLEVANSVQAAKALLRQLEEMGVAACLARFGHNDASYKLLQFLNAGYIKVSEKLLKTDPRIIAALMARARKLDARVIVPLVEDPRLIGKQWLSGADLLQSNAVPTTR